MAMLNIEQCLKILARGEGVSDNMYVIAQQILQAYIQDLEIDSRLLQQMNEEIESNQYNWER